MLLLRERHMGRVVFEIFRYIQKGQQESMVLLLYTEYHKRIYELTLIEIS